MEDEMRYVSDILAASRGRVICVQPDDNVLAALNRMAEENLGAILVIDGVRLVGIFSERDFARKVTLYQRVPQETPVKEVMTKDPLTVTAQTPADECLSLMNRKGVRHLPVVQGENVVGFVSILDVVDAVLSDRDSTIHRLEQYVSETWPI
jgi:CBS domain-containing protein